MDRCRKLYGMFSLALVMAAAWLSAPLYAGNPIPPADFEIPQGAYSANWVEDREYISIMEFAGNYDKTLTDGSFNRAARAVVAQEFFANHPDNYDFLVVFTSFEYDTGDATAFEFDVQNQTQGIGKPTFDNTALFGSQGKLKAMIDMAATSRYELNPYDPNFENVLMVLSHETLHHWAAGVHFTNDQGLSDASLLGRDGAHWNFFLDTNASVEYGHKWQDNGDGTFSAVAARRFYSPLDLYLMGFYTPEQVPPMTLLQSTTDQYLATDLPSPGAKVPATTQTITIEQIINQEGARVPAAADAQKEFRFGFIYLKGAGEEVDPQTLANLKGVRDAFAQRFTLMTAGKGIAHIYPEAMPLAELGEADPLTTDDTLRVDTVSVADGLQWIKTQQATDGAWQDKDSTRYRDTALAYKTLKDLDAQFDGQIPWSNWLGAVEDLDTDSLARLLQSGLSAPEYLAELKQRQNADGGWGLNKSLDSNPYDTALAVQALAGFAGTATQVQNGIAYLKSTQNAGAGWPATPSGSSVLRATVEVLNAFDQAEVRDAEVDAAVNWLIAQQQGDGGFGTDQSTVHETAQVLQTLADYEQLGAPDLATNALAYITDRQRTSGHWEGSIYTTALAISAMQKVNLPNLLVQSITVDDTNIVDGERVKVRAVVGNDSNTDPGGSELQFYLGDPASGGVTLGAPINLPSLPVHSSLAVEMYWDTFDLAGTQNLYAVVDPTSAILESNEVDNTATLAVTVSAAPAQADLEISAGAIQVSPSQPNTLPLDLSLSATVRNLGMTDAPNAVVQLWQGEPETGVLVETQTVSLPARNSAALNFVPTLAASGVTNYTVVLDPANAIEESDETNNQGSQSVTTVDTVDLLVSVDDIDVDASVFLYQDVTVTVTLHNRGTRDAPDTAFKFSATNNGGTTDLGTVTAAIPAGQSIQREVLWKPDLVGDSQFLVEIDPDKEVPEVDETNNTAVKTVAVNSVVGSNLSVSFRDLSHIPNPALEGLGLSFSGVLKNNGTETLTTVEVALFDGNPETGGVEVGTRTTVAQIAAGEVTPVTVYWNQIPTPNQRVLYLVVDPDNTLAELDETDNVAFIDVPVRSLPDLAVSPGSITLNPAFPKQGEATSLQLLVANQGNQAVSDVAVRILVDGVELGSGYTIPSITGNSSSTLTTQITFDQQADYRIEVVVDPDAAIVESNEINNSTSRAFNIQDANSYVTTRYVSPDGDGKFDSTQYVFRLEEPKTVTVSVKNKYDRVVYTAPDTFTNVTSGQVVWDGKSSAGAVVGDGDYRFVVTDQYGAILAQSIVTIDTNRSALIEAVGTQFGLERNLSCEVGETKSGIFYSLDDEFVVFSTFFAPVTVDGELKTTDENTIYPSGLYRTYNDGSDATLLIPHGFYEGGVTFDSRYIFNIAFSRDGTRVAVQAGVSSWGNSNIWSVGIDGSDVRYHGQIARDSYLMAFTFGPHDESLMIFRADTYPAIYTGFTKIDLQTNAVSQVDISATVTGEASSSGVDNISYTSPIIQYNPEHTKVLIEFQNRISSVSGFDNIIKYNGSLIFLVDLETGQASLLSANAKSAKWSPDGTLIALGDSQQGVVIVDSQGSVIQTLSMPVQDRTHETTKGYLADAGLADQFYGQISDLVWNPDQTEVAFVLEDYLHAMIFNDLNLDGTTDVPFLESIGGIYVASLSNGELTQVADLDPVLYVQPPVGPMSFHFSTWDGRDWQKRGELHYASHYDTQYLDLSKYLPDADGKFRIRIEQVGQEEAEIDKLSVITERDRYLPNYAKVLDSGESVVGEISATDNIVANALGKTIEVSWDITDQDEARVEMVAREASPSLMKLSPFAYPAQKDAVYQYQLGAHSSLKVNETSLALEQRYGEPLFLTMSHPHSGHPSALVSAYVSNSNDYLYSALDFGVDNTRYGKNDWAQVSVKTKSGWKRFKITQTDKSYGDFEFESSTKVDWPHKIYHFKIPVADLDVPKDGIVAIKFHAYGSAGEFNIEMDTNSYGIPVSDKNLPYLVWGGLNFNGRTDAYRKKLHWPNGARSLLITGGLNYETTPIVLDIADPVEGTRKVFESSYMIPGIGYPRISNTGRIITFYSDDLADVCARNGKTVGYRQFQSLLNLDLDLRAIKSRKAGGIVLRGTASDKNFSQYQLDYAPLDEPDNWNTVIAPSEELVLDDVFTIWSAPDYATYFMRLTAVDLAGNTRSDVSRVVNNRLYSISNLFRQPKYISPNGDGVQEELNVTFKVLRPVNLEMNIFNSAGQLVRTLEASYSIINSDQLLTWDGRDENGLVVPDGEYRIQILDNELYVNVDSTIPKIYDESKSLFHSIKSSTRYLGYVNLNHTIFANDRSGLEESTLLQKPLDGGSWGEAVFPTLENLTFNEYQYKAVDKAGNVATYVVPESVKRKQVYLSKHGQSINKIYDSKSRTLGVAFSELVYPNESGKYTEVILKGSDVLHLQGVETVKEKIAGVEILVQEVNQHTRKRNDGKAEETFYLPVNDDVFSYQPTAFYDQLEYCGVRVCGYRINTGSVDDLSDFEFKLIWNYSEANGFDWNNKLWLLKLKFTSENGEVFLSNGIVTRPDGITHGLGRVVNDSISGQINGVERDDIESLVLKVQSSRDARYANLTTLNAVELESVVTENQVEHRFAFDASELKECTTYFARYYYTLSSGQVLEGQKSIDSPCIKLYARVAPEKSNTCGNGPTNIVKVTLVAKDLSSNQTPLLLTLGYPAESDGDPDDIIFNINDPSYGYHEFEIDISPLEEGKKSMVAEFTTVEGAKERLVFNIPVTKTLISPRILSPLPNEKICAKQGTYTNPATYEKVSGSVFIPEGVIRSENGYSYSLFWSGIDGPVTNARKKFTCKSTNNFGMEVVEKFFEIIERGDDPQRSSTFLQDCSGNYVDSVQLKDQRVSTGGTTLGINPVNYTGDARLTVEAYDWSGAKVCQEVEFEIDGKAEVSNVSLEPGGRVKYYSPNDDGVYDDFRFQFTAEEPLNAELSIYATVPINEQNPRARKKGELANIPVPNYAVLDGEQELIWDGRFDTGETIPDGEYIAELKFTDGCGNWSTYSYQFVVDTVPPQVAISYPLANDPVGVELSIYGNASDENGATYELKRVTEESEYLLNIGKFGSIDEEEDIVEGSFSNEPVNTFGMEGTEQSFTMLSTDYAGNTTLVSTTILVPERTVLVSEHDLVEDIFSPNGDGRLDTVTVRTKFEQPVTAEFLVVNKQGVLVKSLASGSYQKGYVTLKWDGSTDQNFTAGEGEYKVVVHATLAGDYPIDQSEESKLVILDSIAPQFSLDQRVGTALELKGQNDIYGELIEKNFKSYSIYISDQPGTSQYIEFANVDEKATSRLLGELDSGLVDEEGFYNIKFVATDLAQNRTELVLAALIDPNPPVVNWLAPESKSIIGAHANTDGELLDVSVVEPFVKDYRLTLVDAAGQELAVIATGQEIIDENISIVWKPGNLADGQYILLMDVYDLAGWNTKAKLPVELDFTPPAIDISKPEDNGYLRAFDRLKGSISDKNFSDYEVSIAIGSEAGASFDSLFVSNKRPAVELFKFNEMPADGVYQIQIKAWDKAGNESILIRVVNIDTTPPAAPAVDTITIGSDKTSVEMNWLANDEPDLAGYYLYRNGNKVNAEPLTLEHFSESGLAQGNYSYTVSAVDQAGNESEMSSELVARIDIEPPTVLISKPATGSFVAGLVNIRGTAFSEDDFKEYRIWVGSDLDNLSLLKKSTLALQGEELAQWNTVGLEEGSPYWIRLEAEDLTGNQSQVELSVIVDNTAPPAPANLQVSVTGSSAQAVWDAVTGIDDLKGYLLYRNGALVNASGTVFGSLNPYILDVTTYAVDGLADGDHGFVVYAIDEAGNVSEPSNEVTITLETGAPHADFVNIADGDEFENSLYVLTQSPDLDVAQVEIAYRAVGDAEWTVLTLDTAAPFDVQWNTEALAYGDYEITAIATDINANVNTASDANPPSILTLSKRDLTKPDMPANFAVSTRGFESTLTWSASTEADISHYELSRAETGTTGWMSLSSAIPPEQTMFVNSVSYEWDFSYRIIAVDTAGNKSDPAIVDTVVFTAQMDSIYTPTLETLIAVSGKTLPLGTVNVDLTTPEGVEENLATVADSSGLYSIPGIEIEAGLTQMLLTVKHPDYDSVSEEISYGVNNVSVPSVPTGLVALASGSDVTLSWNENALEENVVGYRGYRDQESMLPTDTAVAIESANNGAYGSENLYDGNPDTTYYYWNHSLPEYLSFSWTEARLVSQVQVDWADYYEASSARAYNIYAWDGSKYVLVEAVKDSSLRASDIVELDRPYMTNSIQIELLSAVKTDIAIQDVWINGIEMVAGTTLADIPGNGVFDYALSAINVFGYESGQTETQTIAVGDIEGPLAVTLTSQVIGLSVSLSWTASASSDVVEYRIYRNGQLLAVQADLASLTWDDGPLPNGEYNYQVMAVDSAGNEGAGSNVEYALINGAVLPAPTLLSVQQLDLEGALSLSWSADSGTTPSSFKVYRSLSESAGYSIIAEVNSFELVDRSAVNLRENYYYVRSVDAIGNISAPSNVLSAVAIDAVPPAEPKIAYPVIGGNTVITDKSSIGIAGLSDPETTVRLLLNGEALEISTSSGNKGDQRQIGGELYSSTRSLLGGYGFEVYRNEDGLTGIYQYQLGEFKAVAQVNTETGGLLWIGENLAVLEDNRIYLYDVATSTKKYLDWSTDEHQLQELLAYSPESGRVYYNAMDAGVQSVYSYNIETSERTLILPYSLYSETSAQSQDGRYLVFKDQDENLSLMDLQSGVVEQINITGVDSSELSIGSEMPWLGDSHKLTMAWYDSTESRYASVIVLDVDSGEYDAFPIDDALFNGQVVASIGADKFAYVSTFGDGSKALQVYDLGQDVVEVVDSGVVDYMLVDFNQLGELVYSRYGTESIELRVLSTDAEFIFESIPLPLGESVISAIAFDNNENASSASSPVTIVRNRVEGFDLALSDELNPAIITVGQFVTIDYTIENIAEYASTPSVLTTSVLDPDSGLQEIGSWDITTLAANQSTSVSVSYKAETAGSYTVISTLEPQSPERENSLANNTRIGNFMVAPSRAPMLSLHLAEGGTGLVEIGAYEDLPINISVVNAGPLFDGTLHVILKSAQGSTIAVIDEFPVEKLSFAEEREFNSIWNSSSFLAGDYIVEAVIYTENGESAALESASFTIRSELNVLSYLVSEREFYRPGELVNFRLDVSNLDSNTLLSGSAATIKIHNASNSELHEEVLVVGQLLPGDSATYEMSWQVGNVPPGIYTATMSLEREGSILSTGAVNFNVLESEPSFTGSLSMDQELVAKGQEMSAQFSVTSLGNAAVDDVLISLELTDVTSQSLVHTIELLQAFSIGGSVELEALLETAAYATGRYRLDLVTEVENNGKQYRQVLSSGYFQLIDGTAPVVEIVYPSDMAVINSTRSRLKVVAVDADSGVKGVNYSISEGSWAAMLADAFSVDNYVRSLSDLPEGEHRLTVFAEDSAGNISNAESIQVVVDNTAPTATVSGIVNGRYYNSTVTVSVAVTDDHLRNVVTKLDGEEFSSGSSVSIEGEHILLIEADDDAGNTAREIVLFGIDTTPANIVITGVENNGAYNVPVSAVIAIEEENVASSSATLDGAVYASGSEISGEGQHELSVSVSDAAGNVSEKTLSFELDFTPPNLVVTSHTNNQQVEDQVITLQGTTEADSIVTLSVMGSELVAVADSLGTYTFNGLELNVGDNVLNLVSVDRAGNASSTLNLVIKRAQPVSAVITPNSELVTSRVLIWVPPKWTFYHPNCELWDHHNHSSSYTHYTHDTEALLELIAESMDEAAIEYHIVRSESEFVTQLRSQQYNSFVLADLTDTFSLPFYISGDTLLEIRANVAAGSGLAVISNDYNSFGVWRDMLGVALDNPLYDPRQLYLDDSSASIPGSWELEDRKAIDMDNFGASVVGEIDYRCSLLFNIRCRESAMTIDRYANGDVAALAFSPASIGDPESAKALFTKLVRFIRPDSVTRVPNGVSEITWFVDELNSPIDLRFEQQLETGLEYQAAVDGVIESSVEANWTRTLSSATSTSFTALVRTPSDAGSYLINSSLYSGNNKLSDDELVVVVDRSMTELEQDVLNYLNNARSNASLFKIGHYMLALDYVQIAIAIDKDSQFGVELAMFKLLLAVQEMKFAGDPASNAQIGYLIKAYSGLWHRQVNN